MNKIDLSIQINCATKKQQKTLSKVLAKSLFSFEKIAEKSNKNNKINYTINKI